MNSFHVGQDWAGVEKNEKPGSRRGHGHCALRVYSGEKRRQLSKPELSAPNLLGQKAAQVHPVYRLWNDLSEPLRPGGDAPYEMPERIFGIDAFPKAP